MATLHLRILTKCLFCALLMSKYIHFAQHTMTSCAPSNRHKDQSGLVQDQSLSKPKKSRTRTNASPTGVGPGLQSGPKLVQSSPVLGFSLVLGPDFQTLLICKGVAYEIKCVLGTKGFFCKGCSCNCHAWHRDKLQSAWDAFMDSSEKCKGFWSSLERPGGRSNTMKVWFVARVTDDDMDIIVIVILLQSHELLPRLAK